MTYSTNLRGLFNPLELTTIQALMSYIVMASDRIPWLRDVIGLCCPLHICVFLPGRINDLLTTVQSGCFLFPTPVDFTS